MIRIRIDKNSFGEPIFKLGATEKEVHNNKLLYRAALSGKKIRGIYNYKIPMKYFLPIYNNLNKDEVLFDTRSVLSYLEFADEIEEVYFYSIVATPKYMRKWREEACQNIYKITIDENSKAISKKIAFKKIDVAI
ncbi:MAG: hypothetical protein ACRCVJ_12890 [Clostridium sp.]|uniref:hypothetical protein n=1 Tax=Clostridium sp. TaxID=1506 RepID=UPI003F352867